MKSIIQKWYALLPFPDSWRPDFEALLSRYTLTSCTAEAYREKEDPQRDLLMYLYFCEAAEETYCRMGISREILLDTLADIVIYADIYWQLHGVPGLSEPEWLKRHLTVKLFKLGRLQFYMADGELEVHIPAGAPLLPEACQASIARSKDFFKRYFPDFVFHKYTCHSWLLDETIQQFLPPDSNITRFMQLFAIRRRDVSDVALRYIFRWDTTRDNLAAFPAYNRFSQQIRDYVLSGGTLYEVLGEIWV